MSMKTYFAVALCTVGLIGIPYGSHAQTAITVQIGDGVNACPKTSIAPHLTVDIAGPCGSIQIFDLSANNHARVDAVEGSTDSLILKSAKIKSISGGPVTNFHITFSRNHLPPPSTTITTPVWYQIAMTGNILPHADGDSVKQKGWIQDNPSGTPPGSWNPIGPVPYEIAFSPATGCRDTTCGAFTNLHIESGWNYLCSQDIPNCPRVLKGELWFTLNNPTDELVLTNVAVRKTSSGGGPGGEGCNAIQNPNPFLSTTRYLNCLLASRDDLEFGSMPAERKATLFAEMTWKNLQQDIARGQGEHLTSLATLLHVSHERQPEFFSLAQQRYAALFHEGLVTPERMVATLSKF